IDIGQAEVDDVLVAGGDGRLARTGDARVLRLDEEREMRPGPDEDVEPDAREQVIVVGGVSECSAREALESEPSLATETEPGGQALVQIVGGRVLAGGLSLKQRHCNYQTAESDLTTRRHTG